MQTKAPPPIESFPEPLSPHLATALEWLQLKQLYRQGWLQRGVPAGRCESVAEHTWGVAVLAMVIDGALPAEIDRLKLMRLAVIHDAGEVHAGDITPADNVPGEEKADLERAGIGRLFDRLGNRDDWLALWEEYERQETAEARLVRELDRLEMAIQAVVYQRNEGIEVEQFLASAEREIETPVVQSMLAEMRRLPLSP